MCRIKDISVVSAIFPGPIFFQRTCFWTFSCGEVPPASLTELVVSEWNSAATPVPVQPVRLQPPFSISYGFSDSALCFVIVVWPQRKSYYHNIMVKYSLSPQYILNMSRLSRETQRFGICSIMKSWHITPVASNMIWRRPQPRRQCIGESLVERLVHHLPGQRVWQLYPKPIHTITCYMIYVLKCFKYMSTTIRNHPWKHLNAFATSKWTKPHGGSCFWEDPVVVSKLFEIAQYRQPLNRYLRSPMTSVFCQILVGFINKPLNHFICVQRFQFLHPAFM